MERVNLLDESTFETSGGLWKGKKGPFATAAVIRNTNFTPSGRVDYSNVAVLQVEEKQLAKRRLRQGDIIVERSGGGPFQPVGRVVFFERDDGVFSYSNFTSRLRVLDVARFEPQFVFYFLLFLMTAAKPITSSVEPPESGTLTGEPIERRQPSPLYSLVSSGRLLEYCRRCSGRSSGRIG